MEYKMLIAVFVCVFVVCESRGILSPMAPKTRFGQWGSRTGGRYPIMHKGFQGPSQGQGFGHGSQGQSNPRSNTLQHSISLDNLQLAPGQTKVIKQTIVLRGRQPVQPKTSGGQGSGKNPRNGRRRYRARLTARRLPQYNQGGSAPQHSQQHASQPHTPNSGLFLLRTSGLGSPQLVERNGVASLTLPIIQAAHPGSQGGHSGIGGQGHGQGQGQGHSSSSSGFAIHATSLSGASGSGVGHSNLAHALLAGSPDIVIIPHSSLGSVTTVTSLSHPGSATQSASGTGSGNTNIKGVHLPASSVTYTNIAPKTAGVSGMSAAASGEESSQIVQTTVEPGEDPPEAP